ncbi:MAG: hypothetical protein AAF328_02610, partial [Planctomycetota bacterium]
PGRSPRSLNVGFRTLEFDSAERVFENPRWSVRGAEAEAQRDARVMGRGQGVPRRLRLMPGLPAFFGK